MLAPSSLVGASNRSVEIVVEANRDSRAGYVEASISILVDELRLLVLKVEREILEAHGQIVRKAMFYTNTTNQPCVAINRGLIVGITLQLVFAWTCPTPAVA